jgi:hypothetical protein
MPLNHLESAGYIARQEEPRNAAPVTNFGFDAGGFVRRLASQGIVISLTPDRQIAIRGPVDPSAKNQIIGHKAEIVGYLEAPAEVIA